VAIAVVALAQLRLYGAVDRQRPRGPLAPPRRCAAIGLIAGAAVALRIVPRVASAGAVLVRGHGLVGALGGRSSPAGPPLQPGGTAPDPGDGAGHLTASHAATWPIAAGPGGVAAAADVRRGRRLPEAAVVGGRPTPGDLGVAAATPVATVSFDLGRTIRSGTLVGVDPADQPLRRLP
jgi:hypothetical protein